MSRFCATGGAFCGAVRIWQEFINDCPKRSTLPIVDMSYPPRYKSLPTTVGDEQITSVKARGTARQKKIIFHLLAVVAIMYATFSGVRYVSRSNLKFAKGRWGCHSAHRNLSSLTSHY